MNIPRTPKGFTLIELLVVIGIIALLASIAVPAFTGVQIKAAQTKALSNAKQIGLACKQYAVDNNGQYPSYTAASATTSSPQPVTDSNSAFDQLFPAYLTTIQPFYLAKSGFTPAQLPDPSMQNISTNPPLPTKANEWAFVTGLYDTSNSTWPLIADGFATVASHAYTNNETAPGGVWKGYQAIVVFCDDSAKVMKCNATNFTVPGSPNNSDLFDTGGQPGWMGTSNTVVNPL